METADFRLSSRDASPDAPPKYVDHFRLIRRLGRGGFADVFLAQDLELDRDVAVKIPRADRFFADQIIEMFREEAQIAASLQHPSIVNIHQVGSTDNCPCYIVMEYIDGEPLSALIEKQSIDRAKAVEYAIIVAEAVQYAHSQGVVHRDIKPSNIIVNKAGLPIILDFGLGLRDDALWQRKQEVAGTPAFMPPEQAEGDLRAIDGRADVWSLGVMLYQLLTGHLPFGGSANEVFNKAMPYDPKPLRQYDPSIPVEIEAIVLRCLSKSPASRYVTAKDLADALRTSSEPATTTRSETPRTRSMLFGFTALAILGLLAIVGGMLAINGGDTAAVRPANVETVSGPTTDNSVQNKSVIRPNAWNNLLDSKPTPFLFSKSTSASHWLYDPTRETLHLTCQVYGLIGVGKVESPDCDIRVEISKNRNDGKSGLYFGRFDTVDADGNSVSYCEAIVLECVEDGRRLLSRERYHFSRKMNGDYDSSSQTFATAEVTEKTKSIGGKSQLQLEFRDYFLRRVTWDGAQMDELVDESSAAFRVSLSTWQAMHGRADRNHKDSASEFGCINWFGDATFEMLFLKPIVQGDQIRVE